MIGAVKDVDGVEKVSASGWGQAHFLGADSTYSAIDPATAEDLMNLDVSQGSLADLGRTVSWSPRSAATAHQWKLGSIIPAEFAATGKHRLHVVGVYDGKGWISDNYIISLDEQKAFAGPQLVTSGLVTLAAGADKGDGAGRHRGGPGRPPGRSGPRPEAGSRRRPAGPSTACSSS